MIKSNLGRMSNQHLESTKLNRESLVAYRLNSHKNTSFLLQSLILEAGIATHKLHSSTC